MNFTRSLDFIHNESRNVSHMRCWTVSFVLTTFYGGSTKTCKGWRTRKLGLARTPVLDGARLAVPGIMSSDAVVASRRIN